MTRRILTFTLFCSAVIGLWSQSSATLRITVKDSAGAAVPGAQVTVIPLMNGLNRLAADDDGKFSTQIRPGSYDIVVQKPGFVLWTKHVELGAAGLDLAAALQLGSCPQCAGNTAITQWVTCQAQHTIVAGETLAGISEATFKNKSYGRAILSATNILSGSGPYRYIGTPDSLPAGNVLCIPSQKVADELRSRYDAYEESVRDAMLPRLQYVSNSLIRVDPSKPVRVVSWIREGELPRYASTAARDTWVTVTPELRAFCQQFVKEHGEDVAQLTLRLEQRLGLPPGAGKTTFVEIIVDPSRITNLFRPCSDPSTTTTTCAPTSPWAPYSNWFLNQYYGSYGQALPDQYPWTSLGYTFDWAKQADGTFVRYGSSEFVIPKGGTIEVTGNASTAQYCAPIQQVSAGFAH